MDLKELQAWSAQIKADTSTVHYPLEFKMAVARFVEERGTTCTRVAEHLGLVRGAVLKWHKKFAARNDNIRWIQR